MMTLEELKCVNLVSLLTQEWEMSFQRNGAGFVAISPFREETDASFYVVVSQDGHWVYCDHSDGSSGSIVDLMMRRLGTNDFRTACNAAAALAESSGISVSPTRCDARQVESGRDWEVLLHKLRARDAAPCLEYLNGRGIDEKLVERLIADGVIVLNLMDGSRYCCFAVRDGDGKLQSLFNRQLDGPTEREKFLLGHGHPFCPDWKSLANASAIHICESIIDALSILTLDPDACVLALPGANFDLSRLNLPTDTPLIDAFDNDKAGRAAGGRLHKQYPERQIKRFEIDGFHDINDYLLNCGHKDDHGGACRLTSEERLAISMDSRPSRVIGAEYSVHHSRICDIRNEAAEVLDKHWSSKRVGRKVKSVSNKDVQETKKHLAEQTRRADFLDMRNDWLQLQVKFLEDRAQEAAKEKAGRQVNRKKKPR